MSQINIFSKRSNGEYSTQIWEYYYAYKQFLSFPNTPEMQILYNDDISDANRGDINILHLDIFGLDDDLPNIDIDKFKIIIIGNMFEHLMVGDEHATEFVNTNSNAYMSVGSYVHPMHPMFGKFISMPEDWANCRDWYTNAKVYSSYTHQINKNKTQNIVYIGGELRSWRKYIMDFLPSDIPIIQNSKTITCTPDPMMGDARGLEFVNMCNNKYDVDGVKIPPNKYHEPLYYGTEQRPSGKSTISYWSLPEFNDYKCVIYAESSMINDEIFPTEKTWKCVVAKTHWILFAGRNSYKLLSDLGINSILELVPNGINFDNIVDHEERYKSQMESIVYLNNHPEILDSTDAQMLLDRNYETFLTGNTYMMPLVNKLEEILEKHT